MKKNHIVSLCALIVALLFLCAGCSPALDRLENAEIRQCTETMLDALIADDFDAAYSLVSAICTEEEFQPVFTQMQQYLSNADPYQLKLLSIYTNTNTTNGQKTTSVSSVYEMTTPDSKIIVSIGMDDKVGLTSFHVTPYEKTDYYITGTLTTMKDANGAQWFFLLSNLIAIGFTVLTLVDCCRHKIPKKVLWILVILLGFVSWGATLSSTGFRVNINLGGMLAYSVLVRYGSGRILFRCLLPVGPIIYWCMRRSLLRKAQAPVTPCQDQQEIPAPEVSAEQAPTATSPDDPE